MAKQSVDIWIMKQAIRFWPVLAVGALLAFGAVFFVAFVLVHPSPGRELASVDAAPGAPFALEYVSDGNTPRVWLDIDCTPCAGKIAYGSLEALLGGSAIAETSFGDLDGYAQRGERRGQRRIYSGKLLMSVPPGPRGATVTIKETIHLHADGISITFWPPSSPDFGKTHPSLPPKVHAMRIWVAP